MKMTVLSLLFIFFYHLAAAEVAPIITYPAGSQTYGINIAITPFIPTNSGGAVPATIPGAVTTLAGSGVAGFADGTGISAKFNFPKGVATDVSGNVYVVDQSNNRIRKITPAGQVTTFAGSGTGGFADGTGTLARFNNPSGITTDVSGNIYVADYSNNRIRKITSAGVVTTFAGSGTAGSVNGTGTSAQFSHPYSVATDASGNVYVVDASNHRIRKITPEGVVTTLAGSTYGFADGPGTSAKFYNPTGVATDASGNVYVVDQTNNRIRKITSDGMVTTFAGSGIAGFADGPGASAQFNTLAGVATDALGNVYVAEAGNSRIRRVTPAGVVTTLAGGIQGYTDATGTSAQFSNPCGLAIDASGNVYVADYGNHRIRVLTTNGYSINPALPAGLSFNAMGVISGTPTQVIASTLYTVTAINSGGESTAIFTLAIRSIDPTVNTYGASAVGTSTATANGAIVDLGTASNPTAYGVCYSSSNSIPTTSSNVVNNGATSTSGNFSASLTGLTPATLYYVRAYATNTGGTNYGEVAMFVTAQVIPAITYATNAQTFAINTPITPFILTNTGGAVPAKILGTVTTLAGSGTGGFADGTGTLAQFNNPTGIAIDASCNIYVADNVNNRIRKITPLGVVSTFAGSGTAGSADGPGTSAQFNSPSGVTTDALGNVYVTDNHRIRKITPAGVVSTLAGFGASSFADGPGISARFNYPTGVATDIFGNVYVADPGNKRIRKINPSGVVSTLAGSTNGFADGTGTLAQFTSPSGVATDASGNVYVADRTTNSIRKITPTGDVTTPYGGVQGFADGLGTSAQFNGPSAVSTDALGNLYVADQANHSFRKITSAGVVTTLAGNGAAGFVDGTGTSAQFNNPCGVTTDAFGNIYEVDRFNHCIRIVSSNGYSINPALPVGLSFDATTGAISGTPTVVNASTSYTITAYNSGGNSAASFTFAIRSISPTVSTYGASAVGSATATAKGTIVDLGTASNPIAYGVCYSSNNSIPTTSDNVMNNGATSTPGTFTASLTGLTPATLYYVRAYATNTGGTSYGEVAMFVTSQTVPAITYALNTQSFALNATIIPFLPMSTGGAVPATISGAVSTLAGSGTGGFADGTGTLAQFNYPAGVVTDVTGNIYVADQGNNRIRKITPAGVVTTFAGSGTAGFADGTGTSAQFDSPNGVATDAFGNIYVADFRNRRIRKITPIGVVTTLAGSGALGCVDGPGSLAQFKDPTGVATDVSGNVYVADQGNNRIRKITPAGVVTTLAGSGVFGFVDGAGTSAQFATPSGVVADGSGNVYVADKDNNRIRKITPAGVVTTLAGDASYGFTNGPGTLAQFNAPTGIVIDALGNVYVADQNNHSIRRITPAGVVTTLAGNGTVGFADGPGTSAQFNSPSGVAMDVSGNVYVTDMTNRMRKITTSGYSINPALPSGLNFDVTTGTISGSPTEVIALTSYAVTAHNSGGISTACFTLAIRSIKPTVNTSLEINNGGNTAIVSGSIIDLGTASNPTAYGVCYSSSNSVPTLSDMVLNKGSISTLGNFTSSVTGLNPLTLYYLRTFATNSAGTGYGAVILFYSTQPLPSITYSAGFQSLKLNRQTTLQPTNTGGTIPATIPGNVTTIAGSDYGVADGTGVDAQFGYPSGLATDVSGNVYVADQNNNLIRKISSVGDVTTLAGGVGGYADGNGTSAQFVTPNGVAIDASGNVYVADLGNNCIRKIDPTGEVTTFAGSSYGFADGPGISAQFANPSGVATDASGNVYVADAANNCIRKIAPDGEVTTLAGSNISGFIDGIGTSAQFDYPFGVATDVIGNVYVADLNNKCIRKVTQTGVVTTLAGSIAGFVNGDPTGVAVDVLGNVYVADKNNHCIRKITPAGIVTTLAGSNSAGFADGTGSSAQFSSPTGVATDALGNVYVADYFNNRIRKITPNGYSISPALSPGLHFDAISGIISGAPTTLASATTYTVTASNSGGTSTASLQLTVPTFWTGASSSDWTVAGNWDAGLPTASIDASIANVANKPVVSTTASCNNLIIDAGAVLTIPAATQLTVAGSITNNAGAAGLVVKADASAANGSLIFHNAPEAPVSATVEMYSKASWDLTQPAGSKFRWQFFGVPVRTQVVSPTLSGAFVRRADESGMTLASTWVQLAGSAELSPFTGYEIVQPDAKTYTFTGQLENGTLTKTLTYTSGATNAGKHIIANPYTAAIAINQLVFGGVAEASVYLYNAGTLNEWTSHQGAFVDANPGQYTVSTSATAGSGGIPAKIPSMQGFLVQTPSSAAASLQIPYSAVATQNTTPLRSAKTGDKVYSIIDVKGSRYSDRMWIFTDPSCTRSFDNGWDGRKMFGSPLSPQLFAMESDGNYQIDAVSDINTVELGFMVGEDTQYTLSFTHENMAAMYGSLYLVDLNTNLTTDITASGSEYTFTAVPMVAPEKRFRIVTSPTALMNPEVESQVKVSSYDRTIVVQNASAAKGDLMLYDLAGRHIQTIPYNANAMTTKVVRLAAGMYVTRAEINGKVVTVQNIIIR